MKKNVLGDDRCGEVGIHSLQTIQHCAQLPVLVLHDHLERPEYLPSTCFKMLCLLKLL